MTVASAIVMRAEAEYADAHWLAPDEDTVELLVHGDYSASRVDDPAIASQIPQGPGSHVICFEIPAVPDDVVGLIERTERLTLPSPYRSLAEAVAWNGDVLDDLGKQRLRDVLNRCVVDDEGEAADDTDPFPLSALPRFVRDMVEHGARAQGVDVGFWAVPAIPILAGCIGNSRSVRIKKTWKEPAVIWAAVIGASGIGKSPGLRALAEPARQRDKQMAEQNRDAQAAYQSDCSAAREAKEPPPDPPPLRALIVDNCTMEALVSRLADNARGVLLIADELASWFKSQNQYRSGDDAERWLSIHGAGPVKTDRKTGAVRQQFVPHAAVSIAGGLQPKVAARHLAGEAMESGGAARILIARPPARPSKWTDDDIPDSVLSAWSRLCESLLELSHDPDEPRVIPLDSEALRVFIAFHDDNGRQCYSAAEAGDHNRAAALSKLRGTAPRLALIFELATAAESGVAELVTSVSAESMRAGIEVVNWFAGESEKLYREFASATPDAEQRLDARIHKILREKGKLSEGAVRNALSRHTSSEDVKSSLRRLEEAGRARFAGTEPTGGRPRRMWEVAQ